MTPLFAAGLHLRQQHGQARQQSEHKDALHRRYRLIDDGTSLGQQVTYVEDGNTRKAMNIVTMAYC